MNHSHIISRINIGHEKRSGGVGVGVGVEVGVGLGNYLSPQEMNYSYTFPGMKLLVSARD